jgi:hypothetical protein
VVPVAVSSDGGQVPRAAHGALVSQASLPLSFQPPPSLVAHTLPSMAGTTTTLSDNVSEILSTLGKYGPALAAIVALNTIVLLGLLFVAIFYLCRRRGDKNAPFSPRLRAREIPGRTTPGSLHPMSMAEGGYGGQGHVYEPVSMALTEDTLFALPSPSYKDGGKSFKRTQSMASSSSRMNSTYGNADGSSMDEPFTPPVPAFSRNDGDTLRAGDRPNSVA